VWPVALVALALVAAVAMPVARRRAYRAGQRAAGLVDDRGRRDRVKDGALLVAALLPAVGFWGAVLAGSFKGLTAFGRDTLRWTGGSEYLVPLTLDGVAVGFGVLAFRAVRKGRAPDRAQRVVWGAAVASAVINFAHESGLAGGSVIGGGYLALLSLFGMVMFHEFLDQFEDGTEGHVRRDNPKFGLRWLTAPWSTLCAALAWRNQPPVDGTLATVRAALDHLDEVRLAKRGRREQRRLVDHQRALDVELRRIELATAKATTVADQPNGGPPTTGPTDTADQRPTKRTRPAGRKQATRRPTKRPLHMAWSPAVLANARLLRQRFGDRPPAGMSDRAIRDAMDWSYVRAQPAIEAYRAGADQTRESSTDKEEAA
jgi:hypothetical protein